MRIRESESTCSSVTLSSSVAKKIAKTDDAGGIAAALHVNRVYAPRGSV